MRNFFKIDLAVKPCMVANTIGISGVQKIIDQKKKEEEKVFIAHTNIKSVFLLTARGWSHGNIFAHNRDSSSVCPPKQTTSSTTCPVSPIRGVPEQQHTSQFKDCTASDSLPRRRVTVYHVSVTRKSCGAFARGNAGETQFRFLKQPR
ncbi:jg1607 [Pararge aegeria aegeria]|uniref:Jg1607 protein n=1 Tax=Pararge aegeria aegeria TaxID=348720 RepID=A0A8S4RBC3_9NEOP|nr:jg1607 [Pararge aegeria aegeria]